MRISDWSSDVCSSDLRWQCRARRAGMSCHCGRRYGCAAQEPPAPWARPAARDPAPGFAIFHPRTARSPGSAATRSEEHTSELQSLMRISYAVFCLTKKKHTTTNELTISYKQPIKDYKQK